MADSKQAKMIKEAIVDGYKRGVCDHNGENIPVEKRNSNHGGSHFCGTKVTQKYRDNYERAFGHE